MNNSLTDKRETQWRLLFVRVLRLNQSKTGNCARGSSARQEQKCSAESAAHVDGHWSAWSKSSSAASCASTPAAAPGPSSLSGNGQTRFKDPNPFECLQNHDVGPECSEGLQACQNSEVDASKPKIEGSKGVQPHAGRKSKLKLGVDLFLSMAAAIGDAAARASGLGATPPPPAQSPREESLRKLRRKRRSWTRNPKMKPEKTMKAEVGASEGVEGSKRVRDVKAQEVEVSKGVQPGHHSGMESVSRLLPSLRLLGTSPKSFLQQGKGILASVALLVGRPPLLLRPPMMSQQHKRAGLRRGLARRVHGRMIHESAAQVQGKINRKNEARARGSTRGMRRHWHWRARKEIDQVQLEEDIQATVQRLQMEMTAKEGPGSRSEMTAAVVPEMGIIGHKAVDTLNGVENLGMESRRKSACQAGVLVQTPSCCIDGGRQVSSLVAKAAGKLVSVVNELVGGGGDEAGSAAPSFMFRAKSEMPLKDEWAMEVNHDGRNKFKMDRWRSEVCKLKSCASWAADELQGILSFELPKTMVNGNGIFWTAWKDLDIRFKNLRCFALDSFEPSRRFLNSEVIMFGLGVMVEHLKPKKAIRVMSCANVTSYIVRGPFRRTVLFTGGTLSEEKKQADAIADARHMKKNHDRIIKELVDLNIVRLVLPINVFTETVDEGEGGKPQCNIQGLHWTLGEIDIEEGVAPPARKQVPQIVICLIYIPST